MSSQISRRKWTAIAGRTNARFTTIAESCSSMEMPSVPLSLLGPFEAAGRLCSFRSAAEEMNLTPSAVSHAVRKLRH